MNTFVFLYDNVKAKNLRITTHFSTFGNIICLDEKITPRD